MRWARVKKLSVCKTYYHQVGLTCEWCWRVWCILLSGIDGLTWSAYVAMLAAAEEKLSLHQACAKKMIEKCIQSGSDARRLRTFFNWDEIANETLTKYKTAQLREIGDLGVHHNWRSYVDNYPEGIEAYRSEGHYEYTSQAGVPGAESVSLFKSFGYDLFKPRC